MYTAFFFFFDYLFLSFSCLRRFGADAVFRAKDNNMTDQDLDAVLERGAKKTAELQKQLDVADKGDMLDFSFDQGDGVQVYFHHLLYAFCSALMQHPPFFY